MRFAVLYLVVGAALLDVAAGRRSDAIDPHGSVAQLMLVLAAIYFAAWGIRAVAQDFSEKPRLAGWRVWHLFLHAAAGGLLAALAMGVAGPSLRVASWGPAFLLGTGLLALTVGLAVLFPTTYHRTRPTFSARVATASARLFRAGFAAMGLGRAPSIVPVEQGAGHPQELQQGGRFYDRF